MIVSFHPIIEADVNRLCAGRAPDEEDLAAIRAASAVILPQGCPQNLYRLARRNCPRVFPNLDVRFDYPGKQGQIRLFREMGIAHPDTELFASAAHFRQSGTRIKPPLVVKLDWGGEGQTVFAAADPSELDRVIAHAAACERSGHRGFLIQALVPGARRCLRVAVIGDRLISYWRVQPDAQRFGTALSAGATIDHKADPDLQATGRDTVGGFCGRTGLQLAGFDLLFTEGGAGNPAQPLMLEINYFFGRAGLGGSENFYRLLEDRIDAWLARFGLRRTR